MLIAKGQAVHEPRGREARKLSYSLVRDTLHLVVQRSTITTRRRSGRNTLKKRSNIYFLNLDRVDQGVRDRWPVLDVVPPRLLETHP